MSVFSHRKGLDMATKSKMQQIVDVLVLIAKIASFLSLVMSVVIKARVLLGLSNDVEKKKKEFMEKTAKKDGTAKKAGK